VKLAGLVPRPSFLPYFHSWEVLQRISIGITGNRGVLGTLLTQRLRQAGVEVYSFDGDITKPEELTNWIGKVRPEAVFHLAALVPVLKVEADPIAAMNVNATSLVSLQDAIARFTPRCWLFLGSTSHVYAPVKLENGRCSTLSESASTVPRSLYGATKLAGENIATPLALHFGTQLCVGRIFSYFHETQSASFLIPNLVKRIEDAGEGALVEVRDADNVRDFLHADMVIDAMLFLCSHRSCLTVNIGSGVPTSVGSVAEKLIALSKKNLTLKFIQADAPRGLVADIARLRKIIMTENI
jgi:nucleoside-diphosphate-sugar epimerase